MTIDELIQRMPKDGWRLDSLGRIRRGNRCPISCLGPPGLKNANNAPSVASYLGVTTEDADLVTIAADCSEAKIKRADYCDREGLIALRRRLLEVCGLREIQ